MHVREVRYYVMKGEGLGRRVAGELRPCAYLCSQFGDAASHLEKIRRDQPRQVMEERSVFN